MKYARPFIYLLVLLVIAGGVLVLPAFQTWYANYQLDKLGFKDTSLNFISASFGKLSIEDFSIKKDNAVFTLPSLDAELPISEVIKNKSFHIKQLEAKGWVLDLAPNTKNPNAVSLTSALESLAKSSPIPPELSIDNIHLEGQIILPGLDNHPKIHLQVEVISGTLNPDGSGKLTINLSTILGDPEMLINGFRYQGDISFKLDSHQHLSAYALSGVCVPTGAAFPDGKSFTLSIKETDSNTKEHTIVSNISIDSQPVLTLQALCDSTYSHVSGTWTINTDQSVLGNFITTNPLPLFFTRGTGSYEYNFKTKILGLDGSLKTRFDHLENLSQDLRTANLSLVSSLFKLRITPTEISIDKLSGDIQTTQVIATYESTRAIELNKDNLNLKSQLLDTDIFLLHLNALPINWLNFYSRPLILTGESVSGNLSIQKLSAGYKITTLSPLTCLNYNIRSSNNPLLSSLSSSAEFEMTTASDGSHYIFKQLEASLGQNSVLSLKGTAFKASDPEQASQFNVKVKSHLQTIASYFKSPFLTDIKGDVVEGDVTGNLSQNQTTLEGHLALKGLDSAILINLSPRIDFFPNHTESLFLPITVKHEDVVSDLTIEGSLSHEQNITAFEAKFTGDKVNTQDLALLSPWLLFDRSQLNRKVNNHEAFWGNLSGKVLFEFSHLVTPSDKINEFSALFEVEPDHIHMKGARGILPSTHSFTSEGTIYFSKDKNPAYRLEAKATTNELPSAEFLAKPKKGLEPIFEGKFSCDADIAGQANHLSELFASSTKTLHLHSTSGILRILKVNIGDTIPQTASTMHDTLGTVGQKMGSFLDLGDRLKKYQENELSQNAENALEITNELSEFGYDTLKVDAVVSATGKVRLNDLHIVSSDLTITGGGAIEPTATNFCDGALNLSLTLYVKGKISDLLKKAHLAASQSTIPHFTQLNQTIQIKGTLNQLDLSQWHDLLGKQANIPDPIGSKPKQEKRKTPKEIEESRTLRDSELGLLPQ